MKLEIMAGLISAVDPAARHYDNPHDGTDYTVWREYQRLGAARDDRHGYGWKFQIDRYTKQEFDTTAKELEKMLIHTPGVAYEYLVDYEQDTGYIHHIFDCEGV